MRTIKPRIVITISGGLVSCIEGEGFDVASMDVILIDEDTEGCDDEDLTDVGGARVWFSVRGIEPMDEETGRDIGRTYDNWALEEGE